jgi:hypothetical protein
MVEKSPDIVGCFFKLSGVSGLNRSREASIASGQRAMPIHEQRREDASGDGEVSRHDDD